MNKNNILFCLLLLLFLASCGVDNNDEERSAGVDNNEEVRSDGVDNNDEEGRSDGETNNGCGDATLSEVDVNYSLSFENNWRSTNFPTNFPDGAHFSPLVGAVHGSNNSFWGLGETASAGIESMAEVGATSALKGEIDETPGAQSYTGSSATISDFKVNQDCPYVSFVSMVAPSHDWFVGVNSLDLRDDNGDFINKTVDLIVYDAGTEEGDDFNFFGPATDPQGLITKLTTATEDTDFKEGVHRTSGAFIGKFVFTKK